MTSKNAFRKVASAPQEVRVSVHFEPSLSPVSEKVDILTFIRGMQVRRVCCTGDMTIDQIGRFLKFVKGYQGTDESDRAEVINGLLTKSTGGKLTNVQLIRLGTDMANFLTAMEVMDSEFYFTSDGDRLCRYFETDRPKFVDYFARLVLTRGGWVAVVIQIDQFQRDGSVARRLGILIEQISSALIEKKLIRKREGSQMSALVERLVSLRLLRQWDPTANGFEIDKERLYDILVRKSFS